MYILNSEPVTRERAFAWLAFPDEGLINALGSGKVAALFEALFEVELDSEAFAAALTDYNTEYCRVIKKAIARLEREVESEEISPE